jgi:hypothetical protein
MCPCWVSYLLLCFRFACVWVNEDKEKTNSPSTFLLSLHGLSHRGTRELCTLVFISRRVLHGFTFKYPNCRSWLKNASNWWASEAIMWGPFWNEGNFLKRSFFGGWPLPGEGSPSLPSPPGSSRGFPRKGCGPTPLRSLAFIRAIVPGRPSVTSDVLPLFAENPSTADHNEKTPKTTSSHRPSGFLCH